MAVSSRPTRSLVALLRQAARLDHTVVDPWVALRNAVGFTAPMAIGALAGSISAALPACVGALLTSFADQPGPYRLRVLRWTSTAIGAGVYTGLSVAASRSTAESVVLLTAASFTVGLLYAFGDNTYTLGTLAILCGVVMGHLAQPASVAVNVGLLVAAGAAGQGLLAVIAWPVSRHRPERAVIAALYQQLAAAARQPGNRRATLPASQALETARRALYGIGSAGSSADYYRTLLSEAERIREELITLAALADRLADDDAPESAGTVRAAVAVAGDVLAAAAAAIRNRAPIDSGALSVAERIIALTQEHVLRHASPGEELSRSGQAVAVRLDALAGQLRALTRATGHADRVGPMTSRAHRSRRLDDLTAIAGGAASAIDAPVLQHAGRLAILMGATDLAGRLVDYQRAYWVPLTIVIILRPDFAGTFQRTAMRVAGQLLGLVLTWALLRWVLHGTWGEIAAAGTFMFGARLCGTGNLGLAAINISGFVVLLLNLAGYPADSLIMNRAVATVIGGAIVVLAMLAWPSWERRYVPARLAELLDSYRAYLMAVAGPRSSPTDRQRARIASRMARSQAEVSVDRAASEPVSAAGAVELGRSVLATSHRIIRALATLDALHDVLASGAVPPELTGLLSAAATALEQCSEAIAYHQRPSGLAPLRPLQVRLFYALTHASGTDPERLVLIEATDRLTDSIDTLAAGLGQHLAEHAFLPDGHQPRLGSLAGAAKRSLEQDVTEPCRIVPAEDAKDGDAAENN